ncbi:ester cyclase [Paraflavitalea soli]|uniref:Ester cyclase n=1 Tax=Paraflavitalea soli TaxID=2315862 RepID=A0A3B7MNB0_9BACT|nr:ester cyclase [Paraflavitalea soli]AXY73105.1 ester cyclase [Paraflavitalea soli]
MRLVAASIVFGLSALCVSFSGTSHEAQNKKIIQRYYGEVWNQGRLGVLDELLDPQYINHTPSVPNPPAGPAGLKPIVAAIRRAFPDLHYEIKDIVVNDSMAVARVVMTGTQLDSLFNLPPTGRKIRVNQMNIEKVRNGKIVEHWRVTDELTLMKQLGFVP